MNILIVTTNYPFPPEKDGQTIITYHLIKELSERHQITLFCFADKSDELHRDEIASLGVNLKFFKRPKRSRTLYYLSPTSSKIAWFQYRHHSQDLTTAIKEADHKSNYDVILLHSPYLSEYLNFIENKPVVFSSVDCLSSWYTQFQSMEINPLKRIHYGLEAMKAGWAENRYFNRARAIILVSEIDKSIIENKCPGLKIFAIPNGVDLKYYRPSETQPDNNMIVFTGAMDFPPNVKGIMHFKSTVWNDLVHDKPDLEWLIVGKNPTLDIFELQSLDKRITVTGYVKDIRPYLWRSTVYISPIKIGTGFKNIIIEALACGKAIVASPNSITAIPVEDGRHLLIAHNRHEFKEKILELLNNPEKRIRLEKAAREFANLYSWSHTAREYEKVLGESIKL